MEAYYQFLIKIKSCWTFIYRGLLILKTVIFESDALSVPKLTFIVNFVLLFRNAKMSHPSFWFCFTFLSGSICVVSNLQFRSIVVFHPHYYAVCVCVHLFGNFRILVPVIFGSTRLELVFCFQDASVLWSVKHTRKLQDLCRFIRWGPETLDCYE